jgi:molybdopterin synthase catalytic subunit
MRVLVFGPLREAFGSSEVEVDVSLPISPRQLIEKLCLSFPDCARLLERCRVAVDGEYVKLDELIEDCGEVALIPPVSGGVNLADNKISGWRCELTDKPIDVAEALRWAIDEFVGAVTLFVGVVRKRSSCDTDKEVIALKYDVYERMAERKLNEIAKEIFESHGLRRLLIIHRVGEVMAGEVAVLIAASSEHRQSSLEACKEAIERIKRDVPLWKKEVFCDSSIWVVPDATCDS